MLQCVRLCCFILFFCSIKCDDLPEDLTIIPNANVINFNEFEVIKYVCIAGNRTSKYTANLFWYQIMSTVGALPVLRARNDVKYTAENSDSKRLELNISLLKDSNMSKIYCLQRYFDWDAGKYYNIAKSKSILLVLEGTDMTNDIINKYNTKTQVSTTERINKKELPSGHTSTSAIIGLVFASLVILILIIIIIVLYRRKRVIIVQESEPEHVYETPSAVVYAKLAIPRNDQSPRKEIKCAEPYAVTTLPPHRYDYF